MPQLYKDSDLEHSNRGITVFLAESPSLATATLIVWNVRIPRVLVGLLSQGVNDSQGGALRISGSSNPTAAATCFDGSQTVLVVAPVLRRIVCAESRAPDTAVRQRSPCLSPRHAVRSGGSLLLPRGQPIATPAFRSEGDPQRGCRQSPARPQGCETPPSGYSD